MSDQGLLNSFNLRPSRIFAVLLVFSHLLAILAMFLLPVDIWLRIACGVFLSWNLYRSLRSDVLLLLPTSVHSIRLEGDAVILKLRDGDEVAGKLAGDSLVTAHFSVLNLQQEDARRRFSVVVFQDSLDAEKFRELRVRLKWGGSDLTGLT